MTRKPRTVKRADNPYLTTAAVEDLSPANRIAYEIFAERRDLLPSLERIMNAGLDEDATVSALTLFRDSLTATDDPNRDPRIAIATAMSSMASGKSAEA